MNQRTSMEKIRDIIRLYGIGRSQREIQRSLKVARPTVKEYIERLVQSGLSSADVAKLSDTELLSRLGYTEKIPEAERLKLLRQLFPNLAKELCRVGVTLQLLYEEYIKEQPTPHYSYSRFCYHFRSWSKAAKVDMHFEHKAGDKAFIDFAGKKLFLTNPVTGEHTEVETYVAILGASQLIFAEAILSQKKSDFIQAGCRMFQYFGGVCSALVPDCLKSAVTKGDKYEPEINPEYAAFARHYGTTILPARPNHPKDKPLVENAVRQVYRRIYARLRNEVFHTLTDLNARIKELLEDLNNAKMQRLDVSRRALFEEIEKSALKPLPGEPYTNPSFAVATVPMNYHVYLREDKHNYSVPFRLKGRKIRMIYTVSSVEIIHDNKRIAIHPRVRRPGYSTNPEHMPSHHRFVAEWNPDRISRWASEIGSEVGELCTTLMNSKSHPEQGYKACLGVIHLAKKYGRSRLNSACTRALQFGSANYRAVKSILEKGLDTVEEDRQGLLELPTHENIRGSQYYQEEEI